MCKNTCVCFLSCLFWLGDHCRGFWLLGELENKAQDFMGYLYLLGRGTRKIKNRLCQHRNPRCGKLGYLSQSQTCVRLRLAEKGDFGVFTRVVFTLLSAFYILIRPWTNPVCPVYITSWMQWRGQGWCSDDLCYPLRLCYLWLFIGVLSSVYWISDVITDDELAVLIICACSSRNLLIKHH